MRTTQSARDTFLLANPSYLMVGELSLFIATAILGWLFSWSKMPLFPALNVSGFVLLVAATVLHILCGQAHKQAHVETKNITHIVTIGAYSKIRHPLYLSLIFMNLGMGLFLELFGHFSSLSLPQRFRFAPPSKRKGFCLRSFPKTMRSIWSV